MDANTTTEAPKAADTESPLADLIRLQGEMAQAMMGQFLPVAASAMAAPASLPSALTEPEEAAHWGEVATKMQTMWMEYQAEQALKLAASPAMTDPTQWLGKAMEQIEQWYRQTPAAQNEGPEKMWAEGMAIWQGMLSAYGIGADGGNKAPAQPASPALGKRFAAAAWQEQPFFAMVAQSYQMFAGQVMAQTDAIEGIDPARKEQLRFAAATLVDALSPDHFPLTNPLVIERALATRGDSMIRGMEHLLADMRRGQLSHTDPTAFKVGENIAVTPGKVVHECPMFQLIQYSPTTDKVLGAPLLIFPPWINRFYILDLNPQKSFVKWAVDQGLTVFMVSWKSADASMADVVWDDYIAAQIEAIDVVRKRLDVPAVHTIGYCVAGTTLAATLAVLARRKKAHKVASATFFTAQVDFEKAGELKHFVDDQQIAQIEKMAPEGFLDGRYMAATFNLLRGQDLIWNYVINNYLLGEGYKPFDLLFWNGDTTNLPIKWHSAYLRDLYRDNRLVVPDSLEACGTPIDLTRIVTPCYIQAGREDHIAPPESVWRFTRHLPHADWTFVLAGSGHIAGVVNPPVGGENGAGKYQHWTNPAPGDTLEQFVAGACEHKGSWWPNWLNWLHQLDAAKVPAKGKRAPGGKGESALENAPGSYVRMH